MKKTDRGLLFFSYPLAYLIITLTITAFSCPKASAQNYDLTGYWESNQGAIYQFRQVDDRLFWYVDFSPSVVNVFYGTIAGNTITGRWADLPGGTNRGQGTVALQIESNDRIVKISETGTYGGTYWQRTEKPTSTATSKSRGTEQQSFPPAQEDSPCGTYINKFSCFNITYKGVERSVFLMRHQIVVNMTRLKQAIEKDVKVY